MTPLRRLLVFAAVFVQSVAMPMVHAGAQSFVARVDRTQVPLDDSFLFEVTLVLDEGRAAGYRPPNFKDFRVLGEHPSQSTQIQMGGGGTLMQVVYSWRYELSALAQGTFTIGPAKVKVGGREIETTPVSVTITGSVGPGRGGLAPSAPAARPGGLPRGLGGLFGAAPSSAPAGGGRNFVRVVPSKTKVYVGEPLTAEWYLYLTERQDKYETLKEPRTDGFWVEDLPIPGNDRGLSLTQQTHEGRTYLVAPLLRRALFPLRSGPLSIWPLEAEISQVDFFGSTMRTELIKADAVEVEVLPLPKAGQPPNFDRAAVGQFALVATLDKTQVNVSEPVTLKLTVSGQGNLRKLAPPELPRLDGLRAYEPKVTTDLIAGEPVSGHKTVEVLLLPQKPGSLVIPAMSLTYFDPARVEYTTARTEPITLVVTGNLAAAPVAVEAAPSQPSLGAPSAVVENVLPTELRPIRARSSLRRDLGASLYRSRLFGWLLLLPPLAFAGTLMVGQIRLRLGQDTERRRGRRMRRQVKRRLGLAERHRAAGNKAEFFIEIDRTVRELLSAKLGRAVSGLSMDELTAKLMQAGVDESLCTRVTSVLEECDRARFAPGSVSDDGMTTALDRAGELIVQLERTRLVTSEVQV